MTKLIDVRPPSNIKEWIALYKQDIRVIIDWKFFAKSSCPVKRISAEGDVYFPWYETGSWMVGGKRQKLRLGTAPFIVQAPAVQFKKTIIVLDGCHRISEIEPCAVLLDVVVTDKVTKRMFGDLLGGEK